MIVDEEVAIARLNSSDNLINKLARRAGVEPSPVPRRMEDAFPEDILISPTDSTSSSSDNSVEVDVPKAHAHAEADIEAVRIEPLYKNRTGPKNIPPMIQTLAVEHAAVSTERSAGSAFGVSHQTVNYYKHDAKKIDRERVKESIDLVHTNAVDAMLTSIGLIKEKLPTVKKAIDLSKIAADMSRVIEKTTPKDALANNIKVIVFAPPLKGESEYEEIEITSINN
jgi:hypothetical protein